MTSLGFALFETPIGTCGLTWSEGGIAGLQLPEKTAAATRARVQRRWPGVEERVPPPPVQRAIDRVLKLLDDGKTDLTDIPLDLSAAPEFNRKVYEVARAIPPGQTMTYGEIARRIGALAAAGARRRCGAGQKSHRHHRTLPSRAGGQRQDGRLLGNRRRRHQAAHPRDRGCLGLERRPAVRGAEIAPLR